ncbi:MAG TPA: cation diffusion facilitator family transporter [Nitrososphaeraceae archaeon]|nr:cation diffusion facilitator family transporter [Nitrososphaeraceae archaeon]
MNLQTVDRKNILTVVLLLTSVYFGVQIIIGVVIGSLALISDAGHMLIDVCGLVMALVAMSFSERPATPNRTYGYYRAEILTPLLNSIFLILLSFYILYEAYQRILSPSEISGYSVILVASVGLAVNLVSIVLLRPYTELNAPNGAQDKNEKNREKNLNLYGAYLEIFADTIGSVGVIISGIVIISTKFFMADALISIGIALFILPRTWLLVKKSIHILIEGTPSHLAHEEIKNTILKVKGVTGVFDLHIWTITSGIHALSAHVVILDNNKSSEILQEINSILEKNFSINHATIQVESYHESNKI